METRKNAIRTRSHSLVQGSNNDDNNKKMQSQSNGGTGTRTRHKSGNASYADLITRAILSSDEKRLTLSEIYDWMVDNVPGLKDQRYLHSAKGWKNAVRHTLSINPRFRKLARLGRPGWWTVDPEYVHRSNGGTVGMIPPTPISSSSFTTTTTALIWDAQSNQQQSNTNHNFRGRLSSAPALFLSPIFASTQSFPSPTPLGQSTCSRPPSCMSVISNAASSPSVASPTSEMGACSVLSPPQIIHSPLDTSTQTVHVWHDPGVVGVMAVPRPLPVRMASVSETGTQTEEAVGCGPRAVDDRHPVTNYRNIMCDYFESVSPVASPLTSQLGAANGMGPARTDQEQTFLLDDHHHRYHQQDHVRMSLGQCPDGRPVLILTNTKISDHHSVNGHRIGHNLDTSQLISSPKIIHNYNRSESYHNTGLCDHKSIDLITGTFSYANMEQLPEDLEGIDVDPSVSCDVVAVIKYEQNMGRGTLIAPKLEPILELSG